MSISLWNIGLILVVAGAVQQFGCFRVGAAIMGAGLAVHVLSIVLARAQMRTLYTH